MSKIAGAEINAYGFTAYLLQLESCEGLAAFEGAPLEPLPSEMINSGQWERSGPGGINFHIAYRRDHDGQFAAPPPPASLFVRWAFIAIVSTITGAWLAFLWRMFP